MDLLMIIGLIVAGTFAWVYFHGIGSDGGEGINDRHNDNDSDSDSDSDGGGN